MIPARLAIAAVTLFLGACSGPRVYIATGTIIGLKATPGDGASRPPSVVLGYKRAELALVPTKGEGASDTADSASTLASLHFSTRWFGHTELDSFIATGYAARPLVEPTSEFAVAFASATVGVIPDERLDRQKRLIERLRAMQEPDAKILLDQLQLQPQKGKTAVESLQVYIARATTDAELDRLEAAFFRRS